MPLESSSKDVLQKITDARDVIIAYLQQLQTEASHSVMGEMPDIKGKYQESHYDAKERRDRVSSFIRIFNISDDEAQKYGSFEDFLKEKCKELMQFPAGSYEPITDFIKEQYGISATPEEGPSVFYKACIKDWAKDFGVSEDEIEKIMPYEKFKEIGSQAAVDYVSDHFE